MNISNWQKVLVQQIMLKVCNTIKAFIYIDSISLFHLYDKDFDNAQKGLCCHRVRYYKYPEVKCVTKACLEEEKRKGKFPQTESQLNAEPDSATNCIDIFIFQQVYWRICHRTEDAILKLKQSVEYAALKTIPGIDQNELMSKCYYIIPL
jgi:hypothetical protein